MEVSGYLQDANVSPPPPPQSGNPTIRIENGNERVPELKMDNLKTRQNLAAAAAAGVRTTIPPTSSP